MELLIVLAVFILIVIMLVAALLLERKIQGRYSALPAGARESIDRAAALQKKRERYFQIPMIALFVLGYALARSPYGKGAGFVVILVVGAVALVGNIAFVLIENRKTARLGNDAEMARLQKYRSLLAAAVFIVVAGIISAVMLLIFR